MGSGHTHRGGRRFNPRRGPAAANGPRGAGTSDSAHAEPMGKMPMSSSSPEFAPRPPRLTSSPSNPSAHVSNQARNAERAGGPARAHERARQGPPTGAGPQQARPFVQMPDPRRAEQRQHQQPRAEGLPPRTSGSHPRPNDHAIVRRGVSADEGAAPAPEYTRPRSYSSQARPFEAVPSAAAPQDADAPDSPMGLPLASEDQSASPDGGEGEPEPDGYRHTQHEPVRPETRGEVGPLIEALHEIFERDRGVASQGASARCGICYLHFPTAELQYRDEEGFYVCAACAKALGHAQVFMVRRQQK